jgi:hypothetical protein
MLPRWLITFRALALSCAFAAAFVPIATYITDDKRDWLWIHIGVNIAAYIAVALTTIYTTVHLTQQDHNKFRVPAYWAHNVVMRTWYLGVSKTWRWHVAAAVGRLGLALALAQHVHITMINGPIEYRTSQFQGIFNQFRYYSYNSHTYSPEQMTTFIQAHSQWQTVLIGFLVLCGFAILETGLLTTLTLTMCTIKRPLSSLIRALVLRPTLVLVIFMSMTFIQYSIQHEDDRNLTEPYETNGSINLYYYWHTEGYRYIFREWHKVGFTWLDNGIMLASWIMRPMTQSSHNYACIESVQINNVYSECLQYNNRMYVLADVLAALASYATYILAIIASLQLAHYLHWRREQRESPTPAPTTP